MGKGRYWLQTLGCPKNQVDSDKLAGTPGRRRLLAGRLARAGRPGGGQHLRLHRGGPPGVDRRRARAGRGPPARGPAGGDRLHGRALRRRAGRGPARGRPGGRVRRGPGATGRRTGGIGAGGPGLPTASGRHRLRPAGPAPPGPARPWAYVKVAEGCDRHLRLLRHPVVPGPPALADSRPTSAGRGGRPGPGDATPGVREIVLVAQDLASYGLDRRGRPGRRGPARSPAPSSSWSGRSPAVVERVRLLYLYPSGLDRRAGRRRHGHRRALLRSLAAARVAAAGRPDAPVGRRQPLPRPDRRHPPGRPRRQPSARRSSSATRARPRRTTTSCWRSWPRPSSTGPASSPSPRGAGTYAAGLAGQVPAALALERLRECAELQDPITAAERRRPGGPGAPGAGRRARRGPRSSARPPRSTASSQVPRRWPSGALPSVVEVTGAARDRPGGPAGRPVTDRTAAVAAVAGVTDAPPAITLRPVGPGHPGQRHHRGPAAGHPVFVVLIVTQRGHLGHLGRRPSPSGPPTGWTDGWPAVRGPPARAPSSTPWPTRSVVLRARCSPWPPRASLPWFPVVLIAVREVGMSVYRSWPAAGASPSRPGRRPR